MGGEQLRGHKFRSFETAYAFISHEVTPECLSFVRKRKIKTVLSFALAMTGSHRFEGLEDLSVEVILNNSAASERPV